MRRKRCGMRYLSHSSFTGFIWPEELDAWSIILLKVSVLRWPMKRTVSILTPKLAQLLPITYWSTLSLFYRIKWPTRFRKPRMYIARPLKTQMMDFWKRVQGSYRTETKRKSETVAKLSKMTETSVSMLVSRSNSIKLYVEWVNIYFQLRRGKLQSWVNFARSKSISSENGWVSLFKIRTREKYLKL